MLVLLATIQLGDNNTHAKDTRGVAPSEAPREANRETHTYTYRETNRDAHRDTRREKSREEHREMNTDTHRETNREARRETHRETKREAHASPKRVLRLHLRALSACLQLTFQIRFTTSSKFSTSVIQLRPTSSSFRPA